MIEAAISAPGAPQDDRGGVRESASVAEMPVVLDARDHALMAELSAMPEALLAAHDPSPLPERIGRFAIDGSLGEGGYGIVYRGRDPELGRVVAIKVLKPAAQFSPEARKRFLNEARAAARLDHAHIVAVHETGQDGPLTYIAYAYCPGPTLSAWVASNGGAVPPRAAAEIVLKLAEAVQHAHVCGVIHRDLKPDNILMAPEPSVTDFGLARLHDLSDADATQTGSIVGTPKYMAPEQATERSKDVGPAADIYSLGAILYTILLGRPPFQGDSRQEVIAQLISNEPVRPRLLRPTLPRDLETICLKCLEKLPSRRYARSEDLALDLRRFLEGRPIQARPVSLFERAWRWCRRSPALAAMCFIVVVSFVGLAGLWQQSEFQRARAEDALGVAQNRQKATSSTLIDLLSQSIEIIKARGPELGIHLIPGLEGSRTRLLASIDEDPSDALSIRLIANVDYRLASIMLTTTVTARDYGQARSLLLESIKYWERYRPLATSDAEAVSIEAEALAMAADLEYQVFQNPTLAEDFLRRKLEIEALLKLHEQDADVPYRTVDALGDQAFAWACKREWARARNTAESCLELVRERALVRKRLGIPPESNLDRYMAVAGLISAEWIATDDQAYGHGPRATSLDAQIDRFVASMREQVQSLGLDVQSVPSGGLKLVEVGSTLATGLRRTDDLEGARQIDARLYALGERLTRTFPDQAASFVILSEACVQKSKNAYQARELAEVTRWKREALTAIERAAALAPDDYVIRQLLTDRQRRVATPTTYP